MDLERLADVARRRGILLVLQFGSSVSGRMHAGSDVDLAVLLEHAPASLDAHADLVADLQTLVPGREVDVVLINRADPLLLKQIAEHGRLLYGSPERLHRLRMYAFTRYQDHRRFLEMERQYVSRTIAALAHER